MYLRGLFGGELHDMGLRKHYDKRGRASTYIIVGADTSPGLQSYGPLAPQL